MASKYGTVAVVTGASRGIGKQTRTHRELRELGADALAVRADLSLADDVERVASSTLERLGGVDILVNNAA
jgi:NAD(P)-dependent dehydrogenase (short-subunit alcohol dehydrogenase family)